MSFISYPRTFFATLTPEWIVAIAAIAVVLSVVMLCLKAKGKVSAGQAVVFVILSVYLLIVFAAAVFARKPGSVRYKLILFWSYYEIMINGKITLLWENCWNILMLLPYGFLLPHMFSCGMHRKRQIAWITILTGFLCSLAVELLQLILKRGFFEFDDMVHNTIGAGIGYFLFNFFA